MTREEAKRRLLNIERSTPIHTRDDVRDFEALEMAIQALSQEPTVTSTDEPMTMVYPTIVCDDAIRREDALNCLNGAWGDYAVLNEVFERIDKLPSVTQKSGKWITKPHVYGVTYCSECDFELKIDDTNYCPNCGAKMESEDKE